MLPLYILVPLNILLIVIYFFARQRDNKPLVRVIQPAAVITSWVLAASRLLFEGADLPLTLFVLAGMGIAIVGDFLNIDMSDMKVVLRGLVIAVIAYLTYALGFTVLNGFHLQDLYVGAALLLVYAFTMRTILPGVDAGHAPARADLRPGAAFHLLTGAFHLFQRAFFQRHFDLSQPGHLLALYR